MITIKHKREVDSDKLLQVEEYINRTMDLTDHVKSLGLKMVGNTTSCPFHGSDSTPSLKINGNKWKCFGCGRGGGLLKFNEEMEKLDNSKATYYDVVEKFVREHQDIARELGGTIYKSVEESFDERWEKAMDVATTERYTPKVVKVQTYDKLLRKVKKCDIDTKIQLLSGIQEGLDIQILQNIVNGTALTGKSLFDLAN